MKKYLKLLIIGQFVIQFLLLTVFKVFGETSTTPTKANVTYINIPISTNLEDLFLKEMK